MQTHPAAEALWLPTVVAAALGGGHHSCFFKRYSVYGEGNPMSQSRRKTVLPLLDTGLMLAIGLLYLLRAVTGWELLWLRAVVSGALLLIFLPRMSKSFRIPAWIFTLCGAAMLIWKEAPATVWAQGLNSMLLTAAIIVVMQTLSIAIGAGNYSQAISDAMRRCAKNQGVLYFLVEIFAHLLCSILNIGEVIIVLGSFDRKLTDQIEDYPNYVSGAIARGHCTAFLWAPGSVTVLMTLQLFGLEWPEYVLPAVGLACLGIALGGGMEYPKLRGRALAGEDTAPAPGSFRKLWTLAAVIVVIVCGISFLEPLFPQTSSGERLILAVAVVSVVWLLSQVRSGKIGEQIKKFCIDTLPDSGSLCAFFISMGFFSNALQYMGLDVILERAAAPLSTLPVLLLLAVVPLVIIAFSLIGVHPMVSLAVLAPLFTQLTGNASALQLSLSTALGCCLSYMLSPFAGLVLLLSHLLHLPARQIALARNFRFSVLYYVISVILITAFVS